MLLRTHEIQKKTHSKNLPYNSCNCTVYIFLELLLGFDSLLEAKRISDLATLYQLLSRIKGGLDELCQAFSNYVKVSWSGSAMLWYMFVCICVLSVYIIYVSVYFQKSGMAMVSDVEREKTMVQELMDFKEKLDTVISDSFQKNEKFQRALQVQYISYH